MCVCKASLMASYSFRQCFTNSTGLFSPREGFFSPLITTLKILCLSLIVQCAHKLQVDTYDKLLGEKVILYGRSTLLTFKNFIILSRHLYLSQWAWEMEHVHTSHSSESNNGAGGWWSGYSSIEYQMKKSAEDEAKRRDVMKKGEKNILHGRVFKKA